MKNLGDITKISGYDVAPVDVVIGGSPCQDLSVAGERKGLDGERSGLFMEQIRVIKEMRDADRKRGRTAEFIRPRYMVWENVPGCLSSSGGGDFRKVLEETAKIADPNAVIPRPPKGKWTRSGAILGEGWSVAWRVHDAQFWGVPQRRRRIALVADFGGETAPEILFERKSLQRDSEESGAQREYLTPDTETSTDTPSEIDKEIYVLNDMGGSFMNVTKNVSGTLRGNEKGHQPLINDCYSIQGSMIGREDKNGPQGDGINEDVCFTLNSTDRHAVYYSQQTYSQYEETQVSPTLKEQGGVYGGVLKHW